MQWFEQRKKLTQFFLNLENKHRATKKKICKTLFENEEIINHVEITKTVHKFYELPWISLSTKRNKIETSPQQTLNGFNLPKLCNNKIKLCNGSVSKKELFKTEN